MFKTLRRIALFRLRLEKNLRISPCPFKAFALQETLTSPRFGTFNLVLREQLEYEPIRLRDLPPILSNWSFGCFEFIEVSQVITAVCQLI